MTDTFNNQRVIKRARGQRQTVALSLTILLGLTCVVALARWMDAHRTPVDARVEDERLYVSAPLAKRMSLGFNGLAADWYWMRSLQYIGRKVVNHQGAIQIDDLSALNLKNLAPLLETAATLDPQFLTVYEYGAMVLPAVNDDDAIKLLRKGIAANPVAWRLYHHLGYIYWQRGDYLMASEIYGRGAKIQDAPAWMQALSARMAAEGGSRNLAREMYRRIYDESNDAQVKEMAARRLLQITSFDERDVIGRVLKDFNTHNGRCASSWAEVAPALRAARLKVDASGAPLDPAGTPYVLIKNGCEVDLDWRSKVPYK